MSVAAQSERGLTRIRSDERWAPALATLLALLLLAAAVEIVLDGAVGHSPLIPKSPDIAAWLQGIGERLGYRVFLIALLVSTGAYAGLVALAGAAKGVRSSAPVISKRWAIVLVGALQLVVFAGPILLSTDVFSYIAYARMGVEHGLNPYLHGPAAIVGDPVFQYVGAGLDPRRHRLRAAVHADLLSAGAARRRRRAVGDEARGAACERRHARARLALRAPCAPSIRWPRSCSSGPTRCT